MIDSPRSNARDSGCRVSQIPVWSGRYRVRSIFISETQNTVIFFVFCNRVASATRRLRLHSCEPHSLDAAAHEQVEHHGEPQSVVAHHG